MPKGNAGAAPLIKNFSQVGPGIYRGGQPDRSGFEYLLSLGVRTVVCLRWNKSRISAEHAILQELGLEYVSLPLTYWDWPSRKEINRFLSIIDDPRKRPVFIHCLHGSDRTGLLVAISRVARDGWNADRAYAEMREFGFHRLWMYHFKGALYDFARRIQQEAETASLEHRSKVASGDEQHQASF